MYRTTIRLSEDQAAFVEQLAERLGLRPVDVIRGALDALGARLPADWHWRLSELPPKTRASLSQLALSVDRVGVNVNQIARLCHRHGVGVEADVLLEQVAQVQQYLGAIEQAVKVQCRSPQ
ncbi:plasmid mobilization relaxosome protein MobC [Corynebacterium heidelbergense]|uniref:Bacterial mobilisation domain-containing protein n=1 Tax=Corynebacterium heidelbergense TaxID=2055947 RepID=A0A364VDS3_9CORY|nr:plasmid mobilization relaxosome protein MobC [Corynebacterium heidelbergense]RAV34768.1 hypothetical protein CWC39_01610 [Corynebacterium heidelbergense]WCZ37033.1 Bacterial mobilization protein (MobC) [Corynebacterium heidelbergense]